MWLLVTSHLQVTLCSYELVYSSQPVELIMMDDAKNVVISGAWKKMNSGGSHLHSEEFIKENDASWQLNPKYLLILKGEGKADVDIVLSRPQWKMGETKKAGKSQELGQQEKHKAKSIIRHDDVAALLAFQRPA